MHKIQIEILLKLAEANGKPLRFSELIPQDMMNDLFNYHLQYLVKQDYVLKAEEGYSITNKGVQSILLLDSQGNTYKGFRNSVLVFVIDRRSVPTKILIQKKLRKPYIGEINPGIAGKIKPAESIVDAAIRKLKEETGLDGQCKSIGVIRKTRFIENSELIDDGFFFVCICEDFSGELITKNEFGENYWVDFQESINLQNEIVSSGDLSLKVLERIISSDYSPFLFEETIKLENI